MPVNMVYHRKSSYLLAMRAWCENHHGGIYKPMFWPWPVPSDDSKHFRSLQSDASGFENPLSARSVISSKFCDYRAILNSRPRPHIPPEVLKRWENLVSQIYLLQSIA
eukprot:CAMPEP_0198736522 /NCGR_PEP_ID=MMETSP1475-20131203/66274_1 /TAXON_ID= ORGANISM="Unidentified sp., Strain CCMP1999" /NCGR_SAMPLE_ID=MMETSP1475 /ASSEMBLY_ACC=CAM_ASM_001111 /LENGTH=107 /DNA_ID=CAMNT_0044500343 /DNA_START=68 /DNA_END=391 /DNA_ORIENTATION=-